MTPIKSTSAPLKPYRVIDLTGKTFGRLTVKSFVGVNIRHISLWLCECICGNKITVESGRLGSGNTKSCGCLNAASRKTRLITHGQAKAGNHTREYTAWMAMRGRCNNPRNLVWKDYGGRGITICERWNDFTNFFVDMGLKPSPQHSLDRINVNGNYEPSNCRWATKREQTLNRRPFLRAKRECLDLAVQILEQIAEWNIPNDISENVRDYLQNLARNTVDTIHSVERKELNIKKARTTGRDTPPLIPIGGMLVTYYELLTWMEPRTRNMIGPTTGKMDGNHI
jgi:hypothetical protein